MVTLLIGGAIAARKGARPSQASVKELSAQSRFHRSIAKLSRNYVEPLDGPRFWDAMTRCATQSLDTYTYLLSEEERRRKANPSPFGLTLARRPGHGPQGPLRVVALDPRGSAKKAGLSLGMPIESINGRPTPLFTKQSQIDLALRPPVPTTLTLRSGGRPYTLKYLKESSTDKRALLRIKSFSCWGKLGFYAKIAGFEPGLAQALRGRIEGHSGDSLAGVLLDLRGNPGGEIDQAIAVADLFLAKGRITRVRGRGGRLDKEVWASAAQTLPASLKLLVLVDGYTASASELLSAALQDHGRALIVGDRTFGKGSIQTLHRFDDGSLLRYTTGRYFSPHDHAIDQRGVRPDLHWHSARRGEPYTTKQMCWLLDKAKKLGSR